MKAIFDDFLREAFTETKFILPYETLKAKCDIAKLDKDFQKGVFAIDKWSYFLLEWQSRIICNENYNILIVDLELRQQRYKLSNKLRLETNGYMLTKTLDFKLQFVNDEYNFNHYLNATAMLIILTFAKSIQL